MSLTKKKVIFKKIYLVKWAVSSSKCRCINKSIGVSGYISCLAIAHLAGKGGERGIKIRSVS